jgi:1-acyl-sn-glycerol-3-phosphate acyltransferase
MQFILKLISIPFSIVAYLLFFFYLCIFHVIQVVALRVFGYEAHKKSVDALNFFLLSVMYVLFSTAKVDFKAKLPEGKPLILVANHQGIFDIMTMGWFLRKCHPKYVSKIELGKYIPSVSFNLRNGGSVLIDRKDPRQALPALKRMGEYIQSNNRSAIIYPEGTRSRDGRPGTFANNGLKILCKYAPDALVVPITINNSWRIFRYGGFPFGMGNRIRLTVHEPLAVKDYDFNTLFEKTEKTILSALVF